MSRPSKQITDSLWRSLFVELFNVFELRFPTLPQSIMPTRESCGSLTCRTCACIAATQNSGRIYVAEQSLTQTHVSALIRECLEVSGLVTMVFSSNIREKAGTFIQQSRICRVNSIPGSVAEVAANADNMLVCFVLAYCVMVRSARPVPSLLCRVPGTSWFAAGMFMLQRVWAESSQVSEILPSNIITVALYLLLNDPSMAARTLRSLSPQRVGLVQELQATEVLGADRTGHHEAQTDRWIVYTWSKLESEVLSDICIQDMVWPSLEECFSMIDQHAEVGYVICTIKDMDMMLAENVPPAPNLQVYDESRVEAHSNTLHVIRNNLLPKFQWDDHDPPPVNTLQASLQFTFYRTQVCISLPLISHVLSRTRRAEPWTLSPTGVRLHRLCVVAAQRLVDIDRNLPGAFPFNHVKESWYVICNPCPALLPVLAIATMFFVSDFTLTATTATGFPSVGYWHI